VSLSWQRSGVVVEGNILKTLFKPNNPPPPKVPLLNVITLRFRASMYEFWEYTSILSITSHDEFL
jgi:hypothetical protein